MTYAAGDQTVDAVDPAKWVHLSSHDSCWRDAIQANLTAAYFSFSQQLNEERVKRGLLERAPKDFSESCYLNLGRSLLKVEIE